MAAQPIPIIDCDGHLIESRPEFAEFMDPTIREVAPWPVGPSIRNMESIFPTLDGIHFPPINSAGGRRRGRVNASEHRMGSADDWLAFLDEVGIEHSVIFTTRGLPVGFIRNVEYAVLLCRAYNDYISQRYAAVSPRLHPMALIPMQDPVAAAAELRRAVRDLGLVGAMIPSTGLPLHLGHQYYWPVYDEAEKLDCPLAVHGGSNLGIGLDTFSNFVGSHLLHHPVPLMIGLVSLVYHGVLDQFPNLRLAFLEGGCAWVTLLLDRAARNEEYFGASRGSLPDYFKSGRILVGCEGNDASLPYVASRVGIQAFAYSSDYPHEVDLLDAKHEVEETVQRSELTWEEKAAVLGGNARRFFKL